MKKIFFILLLMFGLCGQLIVLNARNDNLNYGDIYFKEDRLDKKPKYPIIPEVSNFIVPFLLFIIVAAGTIRKIGNDKQN